VIDRGPNGIGPVERRIKLRALHRKMFKRFYVARPEGFEPPTRRLEGMSSIKTPDDKRRLLPTLDGFPLPRRDSTRSQKNPVDRRASRPAGSEAGAPVCVCAARPVAPRALRSPHPGSVGVSPVPGPRLPVPSREPGCDVAGQLREEASCRRLVPSGQHGDERPPKPPRARRRRWQQSSPRWSSRERAGPRQWCVGSNAADSDRHRRHA